MRILDRPAAVISIIAAIITCHCCFPLESDGKAIADERKSQVGSGDRSERIRTYNYPQSRVTDHRINLTLYKLEQIMNGNLEELIDALIAADQAA